MLSPEALVHAGVDGKPKLITAGVVRVDPGATNLVSLLENNALKILGPGDELPSCRKSSGASADHCNTLLHRCAVREKKNAAN
jgi:hypothetical protein